MIPADPAALEQQLQAAREEAELTLEQLHLVQEELEVYFLKAQDLEEQLAAAQQATTAVADLQASRDALQAERDALKAERDALKAERDALKAERDALKAERDALKAEQDQQRTAAEQATAAVEKANQEKDQAVKSLEQLQHQVKALSGERDQALQKAQEHGDLQASRDALKAERDAAVKARDQAVKGLEQLQHQVEALSGERDQALQKAQEHGDLIKTAQRMLDGQARYLEDLSLKEERAEQAVDALRLLKDEVLYYIQHSKPTAPLNRDRVKRLVELAKESVPAMHS